jgi:serine/threonine protein phosphatase PrpC
MCYIANLGDTRAVMNSNGQAIRMSIDHKSSNENE